MAGGLVGDSLRSDMQWGELELRVSVRLVDPSHPFYVCVDMRIGLIKTKKAI